MNVIKWAGGKRQLVYRLLPLVMDNLRRNGVYHEPFLGGGALAFALPERVSVRAGDVEPDLMTFYRQVAKRPLSVAQALAALVRGHSPEVYYAVRANAPLTRVGEAARFLYLNRTCFNGLHRKNRDGGFNVPIGRGTPHFPSVDDLLALSRRLRKWVLSCGDFNRIVARTGARDVIFADPPYDGTFTSYAAGGFSAVDQFRLATALHAAHRRGTVVIATNADTPAIRQMYGWANIEPIYEQRRVAASANARAPAECVLITALR